MQAGAMPMPPQETPADPPMPPPAPRATFTPAVWVPFALSVALIVCAQLLQTFHTFPSSTGIAIAIATVTTIYGILAGVQALLSQHQAAAERMQAMEHAHVEKLAVIRARAA